MLYKRHRARAKNVSKMQPLQNQDVGGNLKENLTYKLVWRWQHWTPTKNESHVISKDPIKQKEQSTSSYMEALRNHNKAYLNHLTYIDLQNTRNHEQTCKPRGRKIPRALVILSSSSICICTEICRGLASWAVRCWKINITPNHFVPTS